MGLFRRNPNEKYYTGGRKHFTDVIKNTGAGDLLLWKQPEEDFNTNSTLVVMPGEQAIFIKHGKVEQVFNDGTYKLSTKNYPFLSRLVNVLSGGISKYNCVVYFIRKAQSMEIRWGTDSPVQVRDKLLGIATKLRARGSYKVRIKDGVKFLEKVVGANDRAFGQEELNNYFINEFQSKIKSILSKTVNDSQNEILGIDSRLEELSEAIGYKIGEALEEYGIECVKFSISAIDIDDDALRRKYDELGMEGIATIRKAQADKSAMEILGEDWEKQKSVDIMQKAVEKQGATGIHTIGMGLGMGVAMAETFGEGARQIIKGGSNKKSEEDLVDKLAKLKKMLDMELIDSTEYELKKKEILDKI